MDDIQHLLGVPGMPLALRLAPFVAVALWILITVNLWRGGFRDLTERLSGQRWSGSERARAITMIPLRAAMLAAVAAFAAAMSILGLLFNAAVVLNLIALVRGV